MEEDRLGRKKLESGVSTTLVRVKGHLKDVRLEVESQTMGPLDWILSTTVFIKFRRSRFYSKPLGHLYPTVRGTVIVLVPYHDRDYVSYVLGPLGPHLYFDGTSGSEDHWIKPLDMKDRDSATRDIDSL